MQTRQSHKCQLHLSFPYLQNLKVPKSLTPALKFSTKIAGEISVGTGENDFNPETVIPFKDIKKMDKFIQYAMVAAEDAVTDANWKPESDEDRCRTGVMIGSGIGGLGTIYETAKGMVEKDTAKVSPFFIPASLINLASGHVSIKYGFKGPNHSVVTACATGTHAIGDATRLIMLGDADVMIAGGAEAPIHPLAISGFSQAKALSTTHNDSPETASRPWDKDRDGFVMGEGAGIVVLEEFEHAKKRGAKIYAEVSGYGMSGDGYHITAPAPDGNGALRAMKAALKWSGLDTSDINYINAHGTSTPLGDIIEIAAVKKLFADDAYKLSVSSTKSITGHLLGAAGGVEAIYSILAMQNNILPPTANLENPDEGCDIDLVPLTPKEKKLNHVMSNSFGFGGTNASLIFSRV